MSIVDVGEQRAVGPAYARSLPRVRALPIDAIVLLVATYAAVAVAVAIRSDDLARPLGFAVLASWLLYEPLLVAYAGGTIGHRLANLRVVDDRTGGNVQPAEGLRAHHHQGRPRMALVRHDARDAALAGDP